MPKGYNTKISNYLSDLMLAAKKKRREVLPTEAEHAVGVRSILGTPLGQDPERDYAEVSADALPGAVKSRSGDYNIEDLHKLDVTKPSSSDFLNALIDPTNLTPIGAGALVGGAGRFGENAKKAKALLKEWHGLGLKDLTIEHAMEYLRADPKDILKGDVPLAHKIQEAGGNALGHIGDNEIINHLKELGPQGIEKTYGPEGSKMINDALESPDTYRGGVTPENMVTHGEFGPEYNGVPFNQAPRTPEEFDAFHASIPDTRLSPAELENLKGNTAVPGQEAVPVTPQSMVDQRSYEPRRFGREGTGRRQSDRDYAQAKELINQAIISGVPPDEIARELNKVGLKPEDYADMFGESRLRAARPIGGMEPVEGRIPRGVVSNNRQQPKPGEDFEGSVNKLLQATNSWDQTVQHVVEHTKKAGLSKEEVTNKLMDSFGHENPQLSTLVNKHWGD